MTFDPMSVEVTCVTLPKDHCVQVPWEYINVCGYSDQFCKIPLRLYILRTYILRTVTLLFETSEICFGSTKMEISTRKKSILCREKSGKVTLPLLKDISLMPLITNDNSLHVLFLFFPTSIISFLQTDDIKQQVYN